MKMLFHAAPTPLRFLRHGRYGGGPCLSSLLRSLGRNGRRGVISCIGRGTSYHSTLVEVPEFESDIPFDDTKATAKDNALRTAVSQLACEFGRESMLSLQRFFGSRHASVIPTGSLKLDQALGIGGLPKGRIVEIYGREASGKTTLALHIIKEAQKFGGYCAYFDVENAMDPSLAKSMGVNTDNLLISRPDSAENLLSVVNTLVKSGSVDVIVVDSVAALVPQCEIDALIGGTHRDVQSRVMTQALRKIHQSLGYSQTLLVFLNQVRSSGNQGEGLRHMEEVTCGGNALKFYAAVRLRMMRMGLIKTEEEVTGLGVSVQVVKNKMGPAMKKVEMGIQFGKGFSSESEVLEMACDYGIIVKQGSNYFLDGYAFSDKHEAEQYLAKHDNILDEIVMILRNQLFQTDS